MKKLIKEDSIIVMYIAIMLMLPFLVQSSNSIIIMIIFFIALLAVYIITYQYYKNKYRNLFKFLFLISLITVFFPITHLVMFESDKNNYSYNAEFLEYQTKIIDKEIKLVDDFEVLKKLLKTKEPILLDSTILYNEKDTLIYIDKFKIEIPKAERLRSSLGGGGIPRPLKTPLRIYSNYSNHELATLHVVRDNIKTSIEAKLKERKELIQFKNNPISYVGYRDIWIDSFTGFILSNIKPVSFLPQIIQIFQVFIFFIIGSILGGFISNSKSFMLEKKKTKKKK